MGEKSERVDDYTSGFFGNELGLYDQNYGRIRVKI